MKLQLYNKIATSQSLGPYTRFIIWVQGCPFKCEGCMTPNSIPFEGGFAYSIAELTSEIASTEGIEGITISGGEPFSQSLALTKLLAQIQANRDLGVLVYTGYTLTQLKQRSKKDENIAVLLTQIDCLIDGQYVAELNSDNLPLRGSRNQKIHFLTDRYRGCSEIFAQGGRKIEIHVQATDTSLVGVPTLKQLNWWHSHTRNTD